jgi:lipopolysaccharide biosynthesis protein
MMPLQEFTRTTLFRVLRAGFRLTPMPEGTRDRLRQRFLDRFTHLIPEGPQGQEADVRERRPRQQAGQRAVGHVPHRTGALPESLPATLIAFYLPQFHSIPENDDWWGEGFTEWRNVTRALPQYEGHAQPRLPGPLGFYDLRLPGIMRKQMALAREYGVSAFCTYFYWFAGKTLLEAPLQQWLDDKTLDLPICLCWANENWSRRWDGRADDVLIGQSHGVDDDLAFIAYVAKYLRDPRYLRVNGKPMLLVYRPGLLPDARATAQRWRQWCVENGIGDIHLVYVQSFDRVDPHDIGFDAAAAFPPNNTSLDPVTANQHLLNTHFRGQVYDWRELAAAARQQPDPAYTLYPGVNPGWDNEPRRSGRGRVFAHASPRGYRDWLVQAIAVARRRSPASPLVFLNAWNEWAEGAVLEPDERLGHGWLEATRTALQDPAHRPKPDPRPCAVVHVWYVELLEEILTTLRQTGLDWRIVVTTPFEREQAVREQLARLGVKAEIHAAENRGRDILPFLRVANTLLDDGTDVVLKLHTKQSVHREDGATWRQELLQRLASADRGRKVTEAFEADPRLGLVAPEGHVQPLSFYWGANQGNVGYLCRLAGIAEPVVARDTFVAGSMFWVRLEALRPLLDAHPGEWEFEPEQGQVDGTFAHAVERVIQLTVQAAGYRMETAAALSGEPEVSPGDYPYAQRDG